MPVPKTWLDLYPSDFKTGTELLNSGIFIGTPLHTFSFFSFLVYYERMILFFFFTLLLLIFLEPVIHRLIALLEDRHAKLRWRKW